MVPPQEPSPALHSRQPLRWHPLGLVHHTYFTLTFEAWESHFVATAPSFVCSFPLAVPSTSPGNLECPDLLLPCPSACGGGHKCFHQFSAARLGPHPAAPASPNSAWISLGLPSHLQALDYHPSRWKALRQLPIPAVAIPNPPRSQQASTSFAQQMTSTSNMACSQSKSLALKERDLSKPPHVLRLGPFPTSS